MEKINAEIGQISIAIIVLFIIFYFLPSIIAFYKGKSNTLAIVLLNLFLGWSFIGWLVALIWAVSKDKEIQQVIVHNNVYSEYKTINPVKPQHIDNEGMQKMLSSRGVKKELHSSKSHQEKIESLQKLKELLDEGILTQEEFEQQKKQILE